MAVNLGGRGNKAPYEVTHIRIPVPIKETIQAWVDEWKIMFSYGKELKPKEAAWEDNETKKFYPMVEEICAVQDEKLKAIEKLVNEYQASSTHSVRWQHADKLVNEIKAIL